MATQTLTLNPDGTLLLPGASTQAAGLHPGARVSVSVEGNRVILTPEPRAISEEERRDALAEVMSLSGCLAGGSDLVAEILQDRKEEDERMKRKYGW